MAKRRNKNRDKNKKVDSGVSQSNAANEQISEVPDIIFSDDGNNQENHQEAVETGDEQSATSQENDLKQQESSEINESVEYSKEEEEVEGKCVPASPHDKEKPEVPLLDISKLQVQPITNNEEKNKPNKISELAKPRHQIARRQPSSAASNPIKRSTPNRPSVDSKITPLKPSQRKSMQLGEDKAAHNVDGALVQETKTSARRKQLSSRSGHSSFEDSYTAQRIIQLENELASSIKTIDTILSEKAVLERVVKVKDAALVKTTLDLDDSSRANEALKNDLKMRDLKIEELNKINDTLSEVDVLKRMTEERIAGDASTRRSQISSLPEESLDRIILLENTMKVKDQKIKALESEVHTLKNHARKRDKYIDELNTEIADLKFKQDRAFDLECRNNELNVAIDKLTKEIRTLTTVQKSKDVTIEKLSAQIDALKSTKEESRVVQNQSLAKDKRIKDLELEIVFANRALEGKEQEIVRIINDSDSMIPVRSLENDKRYLTAKLKKLQDKLDENTRTITWQNGQIEKFTQRFNNITTALKETKIGKLLKQRRAQKENVEVTEQVEQGHREDVERSDTAMEEMIPASLFNVLQINIEEMRKLLNEKEIVNSDKDIIIETLEKKVNVLERSLDSNTRQSRAKIQQLEEEIEVQKNIQKNQDMESKQRENDLKKELHSMKRRLQKTSMHVKS